MWSITNATCNLSTFHGVIIMYISKQTAVYTPEVLITILYTWKLQASVTMFGIIRYTLQL